MSPEKKSPPRKKDSQETRLYGRHACRAVFRVRPQDIIKVYLQKDLVKEFAELLRWCAQNKRGYNLVESAELDRISAATHHEGICIVLKKKWVHLLQASSPLLALPEALVVFLDGVENPHNVGTVLRNAAHFGATAVAGVEGEFPAHTASATRVAEGGAEYVEVVQATKSIIALKLLQSRGYSVVTTSSHATRSLYDYSFPPKTVLVFGAEREGVSDAVLDLADQQLTIPGTGNVGSLNIASASAVILGEWYRQKHGDAQRDRIPGPDRSRRPRRR